MNNYLITGYWGEPHVTPENDRGINAAVFGAGRFVLPVGKQFSAEYIGGNTIRMYDGKLLDNGAAAGIPAGQWIDFTIPGASQGLSRNDLIIFEYRIDASTMIETGTFKLISGAEAANPTDPELTQEDLLSNEASTDQMALWRIPVTGATVSAPVQIFSVSKNLSNVSDGADAGSLSGTVPVKNGGTGATTASGAIANLGGVKKSGDTMTGTLIAPQVKMQSGSNYPYMHFEDASGGAVGSYGFSHVSGAYRAQVVYKAEDTAYTEEYRFPTANSGRTGNGYYDILTTKTVTYGTALPAAGTKGRIFFKKVSS